MAKTSPDVVIKIYEAPGPQKAIAARYGVSITTVCQIKTGAAHRRVVRRHYEDKVRAEFGILATLAAEPYALVRV